MVVVEGVTYIEEVTSEVVEVNSEVVVRIEEAEVMVDVSVTTVAEVDMRDVLVSAV